MKHTLILAAASVACCTVALAQNSVNGQIDANAGLGAAMPYGGSVKLDIKAQKWTFQPMIGVEGVGKKASTELEDLGYTYTSSGHRYVSYTELQSEGYDLKYGLGVRFDADVHNTVSLSIGGNHRDVEVTGERLEGLGGDKLFYWRSSLRWPQQKDNNLNVSASILHKTNRPGESLLLQYTLKRQDLDETMLQAGDFTSFSRNEVLTDATSQYQTLLLDWKRPLAPNQLLEMGARYDDIALSSTDVQKWDGNVILDDAFEHNTHTGAAFVAYSLRTDKVTALARFEYDYTRQQDRTLHDWIPMANLTWQATEHGSLTASYVRRVIRPTLEYLNPAPIKGAFTVDRGTADLEGIHFNSVSLAYRHKQTAVDFATTLQHIFVEDGFNAIWLESNDIRTTFWGNAGVRRAWSLTPDVKWTLSPLTTVKASVQVLWDKRIAYAINMAKEHWGVTARAELQQVLPKSFLLNLKAGYSEGNTVDLYSHEGSSFDLGAQLKHTFLRCPRLSAGLSYDYRKHPHLVLTQGAYTGDVYRRSGDRYALSAQLTYKF